MIINQIPTKLNFIAILIESQPVVAMKNSSWYEWCNSRFNTIGAIYDIEQDAICIDDRVIELNGAPVEGDSTILDKQHYVLAQKLVLIDFEYTTNSDGTVTLTGWKGTLNGVPSTELVIPDNENIVL